MWPGDPILEFPFRHFHVLYTTEQSSYVEFAKIAETEEDLARADQLAPRGVDSARSIQLSNLQTDDNFVLLGSPRSNPWMAPFSDQMSFRFSYDKASSQEIILNVHPGPHEKYQYVPTALGWATGQSYAILAMVRNPDQDGNILLLSGANAEGIEAAGKLVTDLPRLTAAFKTCGITPGRPVCHFELLLRLNMMAGSPTNVNVEACHVLPETDGH